MPFTLAVPFESHGKRTRRPNRLRESFDHPSRNVARRSWSDVSHEFQVSRIAKKYDSGRLDQGSILGRPLIRGFVSCFVSRGPRHRQAFVDPSKLLFSLVVLWECHFFRIFRRVARCSIISNGQKALGGAWIDINAERRPVHGFLLVAI